MLFDSENPVVQCCAEGMNQEALSGKAAAARLFAQAWGMAANDMEHCIAAHYLARVQDTAAAKLEWDVLALQYALNSTTPLQPMYPSLYLNIAKGHEDLGDHHTAEHYYLLALSYVPFLQTDGYGDMISAGIHKGRERIKNKLILAH